jgi:DNA-binding NtrC family response regulator
MGNDTLELNDEQTALKEEFDTIKAALLDNDLKRRETSGQLGISERTLYKKLKEVGLQDIQDIEELKEKEFEPETESKNEL